MLGKDDYGSSVVSDNCQKSIDLNPAAATTNCSKVFSEFIHGYMRTCIIIAIIIALLLVSKCCVEKQHSI